MQVIKLIVANWDSVLLVISVVGSVIFLYRRGEIAVLENLLFTLVIQAERDFGSGTGELKRAVVITWVYERLPKIVTFILTPKNIDRLLETALTHAKKKWATNPKLHEYVYGRFSDSVLSEVNSAGEPDGGAGGAERLGETSQ